MSEKSIEARRFCGFAGGLATATAMAIAWFGQTSAAEANPMHAHAATEAVSIVRDATEVPPPIGVRAPQRIRVDLETVEVTGKLTGDASYHYWTFNRKVPGPFVRVRVGDTIEVRLTNAGDSALRHSVDFHAVTGPGGGAQATDAAPGQRRSFTFRAINPGLYVYHCATAPVAQHIANGMYGLILVEPEGGLPAVDHEFYVMQGELYTGAPIGANGGQVESTDKLLDEDPKYFVFNGAVGALATEKPLKAKVGETVRIYFGVGGPNFTASFHVVGEIFDKVRNLASLTGEATTDVQTVTVPPGGATMVEFKLDVPGRYVLVDHALSRIEKGLVGILQVEGPANPDTFLDPDPTRPADFDRALNPRAATSRRGVAS